MKLEEESNSNNGSSSTVTIPLGVEEGNASEYNRCTENGLDYSASEEECGTQYPKRISKKKEDINPEDVSEENLQDPVRSDPTRSCNNCKMKTVPILSYGRAGKIRMENLAKAQRKLDLRNDLRTSGIHSRNPFSEKEEENRRGENWKKH
ncbi:hypothetical protein OUZ56_024635 [Daphnia magna]|uniref:Uncharacterized protein n=1 Tax=Daphnia magna TaxID=35525 RepID=A0ABR0B1E3_9CRUS|nr:hypothetical protein OUZ56_024635 [Daphnia magna]